MGSDSNGPILAVWSPEGPSNSFEPARFSFLDLGTLRALKTGSMTLGGFQGIGSVSPSAGSFVLHPFFQQSVHVRASAGGNLFALWQSRSSPSGFQTLTVSKGMLSAIYNHDDLGYLAPGPDGLTIFTGLGGRRGAEGRPVDGSDSRPPPSSEMTVPSSDPAYYLSVGRLTDARPNNAAPALTASVYSADGTRLLTIAGLDEMNALQGPVSRELNDFSEEKRFYLVPAACLLITIPLSNDRLFLRKLDIDMAIDRLGSHALNIKSPPVLYAKAGTVFEHQIEARSSHGKVKYTLSDGPERLTVSPSGKVAWVVPKGAAGETVKVVVSVAEASGREQFHTITIRVH
jgi:hypothetical protein